MLLQYRFRFCLDFFECLIYPTFDFLDKIYRLSVAFYFFCQAVSIVNVFFFQNELIRARKNGKACVVELKSIGKQGSSLKRLRPSTMIRIIRVRNGPAEYKGLLMQRSGQLAAFN